MLPCPKEVVWRGPGFCFPCIGSLHVIPVTGAADAAGRRQGSALVRLASVLPATTWEVHTNAVTQAAP